MSGSDLFYFNYLIENYPAQWGSSQFELLPMDLHRDFYANWKEVYDNYLAYLESQRVPAQIPRFQEAPEDIFNMIFLMTPMEEIPQLVKKYCKHDPERCSAERDFWKLLWKRDINGKIPENVKEKYLEFVSVFNREQYIQGKFYFSIKFGAINLLPRLIELGANISAENNAAIGFAGLYGYLEIIKYLVSQGAALFSAEKDSLWWPAAKGHLEIIKYLISQGADISKLNSIAFRSAASNGHLEVVKYLVSQGADISTKNYDALYMAAQNGHLEVVNFLLGKIPDKNVLPADLRIKLGIF